MTLAAFTDAIARVTAEQVANARTIIPGKVSEVTSDESREVTATFETGIGRRQGGEESSYGSIPNAPVLYPGGGGFSVRFPVDTGDECVALVSDRAIDRWRANREPGQAPTFERDHNASDSLILPVAMTAPDGAPEQVGSDFVISGPAGECMRVVPEGAITITKQGDGTVATITLADNGSITIVAGSGQTVIIGDELLAATLTKWPAWSAAFDAYRQALTAAGAGPAFAGSAAADGAYELAIGLNSPETSVLKGS